MVVVGCEAGTYSSARGASSDATCTPCRVGTSSQQSGATSNATCKICSPGSISSSTGRGECDYCYHLLTTYLLFTYNLLLLPWFDQLEHWQRRVRLLPPLTDYLLIIYLQFTTAPLVRSARALAEQSATLLVMSSKYLVYLVSCALARSARVLAEESATTASTYYLLTHYLLTAY